MGVSNAECLVMTTMAIDELGEPHGKAVAPVICLTSETVICDQTNLFDIVNISPQVEYPNSLLENMVADVQVISNSENVILQEMDINYGLLESSATEIQVMPDSTNDCLHEVEINNALPNLTDSQLIEVKPETDNSTMPVSTSQPDNNMNAKGTTTMNKLMEKRRQERIDTYYSVLKSKCKLLGGFEYLISDEIHVIIDKRTAEVLGDVPSDYTDPFSLPGLNAVGYFLNTVFTEEYTSKVIGKLIMSILKKNVKFGNSEKEYLREKFYYIVRGDGISILPFFELFFVLYCLKHMLDGSIINMIAKGNK